MAKKCEWRKELQKRVHGKIQRLTNTDERSPIECVQWILRWFLTRDSIDVGITASIDSLLGNSSIWFALQRLTTGDNTRRGNPFFLIDIFWSGSTEKERAFNSCQSALFPLENKSILIYALWVNVALLMHRATFLVVNELDKKRKKTDSKVSHRHQYFTRDFYLNVVFSIGTSPVNLKWFLWQETVLPPRHCEKCRSLLSLMSGNSIAWDDLGLSFIEKLFP
jgi:hypothetical protein